MSTNRESNKNIAQTAIGKNIQQAANNINNYFLGSTKSILIGISIFIFVGVILICYSDIRLLFKRLDKFSENEPRVCKIALLPCKGYIKPVRSLEYSITYEEALLEYYENRKKDSSSQLDIRLFEGNEFPLGYEQARRIGKSKNADLILWCRFMETPLPSVFSLNYVLVNNHYYVDSSNVLGSTGLQPLYHPADLLDGIIQGPIDFITNWIEGVAAFTKYDYQRALFYFTKIEPSLDTIKYSANTYSILAEIYIGLGRYDKAINEQLKGISKLMYEKDSLDQILAQPYLMLSQCYGLNGNIDLAWMYATRSKTILEETLGDSVTISLADTYDILSWVNNLKGDRIGALEANKKAFSIKEMFLDSNDIRWAQTLGFAAISLDANANYNLAVKYANRAITLLNSHFGNNHPNIISLYNYLCTININQGKYVPAKPNCEAAYKLMLSHVDSLHPDLAIITVNLGVMFDKIGDYQTALKYSKRGLDIIKQHYPQEQQYLAAMYNHVGNTFMNICEYDSALIYFLKEREINNLIYSGNHPSIAGNYFQLGSVSIDLGLYSDALYYAKKCLAMRIALLDENDSFLAYTYNLIGQSYALMGSLNKANIYFDTGIKIFEKVNPNHPGLALIKSNKGVVLHRQNKLDSAFEYQSDAICIAEIAFLNTPDHLAFSRYYNKLGALYLSLENLLLAEEKLLESISILNKNNLEYHPYLAEAYLYLSQLYTAKNDIPQAINYIDKAILILKTLHVSNLKHPDLIKYKEFRNSLVK